MELLDLCNVIQDTADVHISILSTSDDYNTFCSLWKFHDGQDYLNPDTLEWLLRILDPMKTLFYLDCFRIRFAFLWLEKTPVAIGPYCTEMLTESDYKILSKEFGLTDVPAKDVLVYRGHFPVTTENNIMHLVHCLVKHATDDTTPRLPTYIDASTFYKSTITSDEAQTYKSYPILVQERFAKEAEFMENIKHGNRIEALKNWKELHNSVDYLKRSIGYTIENARISAAVTRTAIRFAGMQAGLPAELADWMSGISAKAIRESKNIEEINTEHERLIQTFCNAVHSYRTQNYSSLIISAIYEIERTYKEEISISNLAEELDVSTNHFITQFKKETGLTPGQYIRKERLSRAEWLLVSSKKPVQEICLEVGIPDSNYFAKIFHREYGETPSEYRKRR